MANTPYIKRDVKGHPYNSKFPPDKPHGRSYGGYSTPARECLFQDFAVYCYDLQVKYGGRYYYFMVDEDCVWLSDSEFTATLRRFSDANDALENFLIDGRPLASLVDKLEDYEPM